MIDILEINPRLAYFSGICLLLLILIVVSFIIHNRKSGRLEQDIDELGMKQRRLDGLLESMQKQITALNDAVSEMRSEDQKDSASADLKSRMDELAAKVHNLSNDYRASLNIQKAVQDEIASLKSDVSAVTFRPAASAMSVSPAGGVKGAGAVRIVNSKGSSDKSRISPVHKNTPAPVSLKPKPYAEDKKQEDSGIFMPPGAEQSAFFKEDTEEKRNESKAAGSSTFTFTEIPKPAFGSYVKDSYPSLADNKPVRKQEVSANKRRSVPENADANTPSSFLNKDEEAVIAALAKVDNSVLYRTQAVDTSKNSYVTNLSSDDDFTQSADLTAAMQKAAKGKEESKTSETAPVVNMIYDADYVRRQKVQKPFGVSIDTLDKVHTFIDAGVSLSEISAKTGLSEDELRLLYDVDEDGRVHNSGDMFKDESALEIMHGGGNDPVDIIDRSMPKERTEAASAVLDSSERREIESIMQDSGTSAFAASADESSDNNNNKGSDRQSRLSKIRDENFNENLDEIDRLADSLIREERDRRKPVGNEGKKHQQQPADPKDTLNAAIAEAMAKDPVVSRSDDPLNVLDDFAVLSGSGNRSSFNAAGADRGDPIGNEDYIKDLNAGIDAAFMAEDLRENRKAVQSTHSSQKKAGNNRGRTQPAVSDAQSRQQRNSISPAPVGRVGNVTDDSLTGSDNINRRSGIVQAKGPERISAESVLAQQRNAVRTPPSGSSAYKGPIGIGNEQDRSSGDFIRSSLATVGSRNPGVADVLGAPMGIGDVFADGAEDPADVLKQAVQGGFSALGSTDMPDTIPGGALTATPDPVALATGRNRRSGHVAGRKARNAYGIGR